MNAEWGRLALGGFHSPGYRACFGSFDAALSLLAAVLPGWRWTRGTDMGIWVHPNVETLGFFGEHLDPARALLLAIIAAKIEEERNAG